MGWAHQPQEGTNISPLSIQALCMSFEDTLANKCARWPLHSSSGGSFVVFKELLSPRTPCRWPHPGQARQVLCAPVQAAAAELEAAGHAVSRAQRRAAAAEEVAAATQQPETADAAQFAVSRSHFMGRGASTGDRVKHPCVDASISSGRHCRPMDFCFGRQPSCRQVAYSIGAGLGRRQMARTAGG
jgi:hypothetical protein